MPQLSIETFVTQYFWLVVFLFTNYILSATLYLPKFAEIYKTRKKLLFISSSEIFHNQRSFLAKNLISDILKFHRSSLSLLKFDHPFLIANQSWIKKFN
jgi:hypothetical protein